MERRAKEGGGAGGRVRGAGEGAEEGGGKRGRESGPPPSNGLGLSEARRLSSGPPPSSPLLPLPHRIYLSPATPSRGPGACLYFHNHSIYPSQFSKPDAGPKRRGRPPPSWERGKRGDPLQWGPRLAAGSRVRSESLSESSGQAPRGWGARGAEMRGYRLRRPQPPFRVDLAATPRRPRNDSDNPSHGPGSRDARAARLRPVPCVCARAGSSARAIARVRVLLSRKPDEGPGRGWRVMMATDDSDLTRKAPGQIRVRSESDPGHYESSSRTR